MESTTKRRRGRPKGSRNLDAIKVHASDLVGKRFGRLTVLLASTLEFGIVTARCECGGHWRGKAYTVAKGLAQSCGCLAREAVIKRCTKHGLHKTAEYETWRGMIRRCYRPNFRGWLRYGGRGIKVCDQWREGDGERSGLECFIADMGQRPSPRHSLDRINNDGDYEPGNCRWATRRTQARNSRHITWFGDKYREAVYGTPADAANTRFYGPRTG